jgi:hypothetical protein
VPRSHRLSVIGGGGRALFCRARTAHGAVEVFQVPRSHRLSVIGGGGRALRRQTTGVRRARPTSTRAVCAQVAMLRPRAAITRHKASKPVGFRAPEDRQRQKLARRNAIWFTFLSHSRLRMSASDCGCLLRRGKRRRSAHRQVLTSSGTPSRNSLLGVLLSNAWNRHTLRTQRRNEHTTAV